MTATSSVDPVQESETLVAVAAVLVRAVGAVGGVVSADEEVPLLNAWSALSRVGWLLRLFPLHVQAKVM